MAQGCCQLVWHSSTEEEGRQFTLNTAAVHWCLVTASLYAEWIFIGVSVIGVNAVAQGCWQLLWHSSTEEQGRQFTLNSAAVHWCMVTAHLYAEWILIGVSVIGVNAVAPGCCQLVWHSSTEQQGRHFTLNTAAVHWCMVTAHTDWIFKGVNAVAQGCCQLVWHSSTEEHGRQSTLNTAAVHWCLLTAHLPAEWIFIGVNAVAQGCCQLLWHSSTEEQGRQFTLNTAAVHWCMVTAHLYAEWILIGVSVIGENAVAPGCCQLIWHSSTEEQGRHFTLNTAAVHWCMLTAHLYAEWILIGVSVIGVNAVAPGCCQLVWHSSTEQQGRHFTLNTAAVHWCMVTAHTEWIFKGVNAVAPGCCQLVWHSSTEEQGRQFTLNTAAVHWCMVTAHLYAEWIFKGVNAVAQGCCQLLWHSSTEEQGRQFTLNSASVHWCLVTASLYAEWIFIGVSVIGVNAVAQGCCQLVWHSSTEEQGRQFTLNSAAVHWCMVTAHLYAECIFKGVNAVAQACCQLVWHSSTEEQGRQFTLNTAAVHWCLVIAHL